MTELSIPLAYTEGMLRKAMGISPYPTCQRTDGPIPLVKGEIHASLLVDRQTWITRKKRKGRIFLVGRCMDLKKIIPYRKNIEGRRCAAHMPESKGICGTNLMIKKTTDAGAPTSREQKAGKYAKAVAGIAVMASMVVMEISPVYCITYAADHKYISEYGPGVAQPTCQEYETMDDEQVMLQDLCNGFLASEDGYYRTQAYYPVKQYGNWMRKLETGYLYSVKPKYWMYYDSSGTDMCQVVVESQDADMGAVRQKEEAYRAEIKRLVSEVEGKTVEEKVRYFHDYLVKCCEYDYSRARSRPYDCLIEGMSTCNGYAAAFYNLCSAAGLEVGYIAGIAETDDGTRGFHAWNRVKAEDGEWLYYDVTWDDTLGSYEYYGLTQEEMEQDHVAELMF